MASARPRFLMLLMQAVRLAFSLARDKAGSNSAARMAMMAMTTRSSINVNALQRLSGTGLAQPQPAVNSFMMFLPYPSACFQFKGALLILFDIKQIASATSNWG